MNIPSVHESINMRNSPKINKATEEVGEDHLAEADAIVREEYPLTDADIGNDDIIDIA